jgi:hypothetical protein
MVKIKTNLLKLKEMYYLPNHYRIVQQFFVPTAIVGGIGNIFFYLFLVSFSNYWESIILRIIVVFLFLSLLLFPTKKELNRMQEWLYEMILFLNLPVFFIIYLFMNEANIYWAISLFLASVLYGLMSHPSKALVLFPLSFLITLPLLTKILPFDQAVVHLWIQLFVASYFVCIIMNIFMTVFRGTIFALEQSRSDIEDKKMALEHALADVKTLSGILPICSFCKQIRNDAGYWQQVEQYVTEHSDVLFSHSICEECAKKHYGYIKGEGDGGERS